MRPTGCGHTPNGGVGHTPNDPNEVFIDKAIGEMRMKLWSAPTPAYNWSVMHQEWLTAVQSVFNLEKTPEQALADVTQKLNALAGV